jgi:glyoxylase-like metal-dependent hydrolase (beta-lactamase superfamily II)
LPKPAVFRVGDAKVTVFEVASLTLSMKDVFGPKVDLAKYFDRKTIAAPELFPTSSTLIESGSAKVMVDPSDFKRLVAPGHFKAPPRYRPPPPLPEQLEAAGVGTEEITQVVITHLHFDHYAGVTTDGGLAFPMAEYYIPKRDWEMADIAEARTKGDRDVTETLGAVEEAGKLHLLGGPLALKGGITVEPYPGESPGHQVVRVGSKGKVAYCVGDLYHLVAEVEHPELAAGWTDAKVLLASRKKFSRRAAAEKALVLPGHLPAGVVSFRGPASVWTAAR